MPLVVEGLDIAVEHLRVAKGEMDNVHSAALRDLANAVKFHVEDNWPIDTGESLAGWQILRTGPVDYSIGNPVDYTSYVWNNVSHSYGPAGTSLAIPLIEEGIERVSEDIERWLSDAVVALLEEGAL